MARIDQQQGRSKKPACCWICLCCQEMSWSGRVGLKGEKTPGDSGVARESNSGVAHVSGRLRSCTCRETPELHVRVETLRCACLDCHALEMESVFQTVQKQFWSRNRRTGHVNMRLLQPLRRGLETKKCRCHTKRSLLLNARADLELSPDVSVSQDLTIHQTIMTKVRQQRKILSKSLS